MLIYNLRYAVMRSLRLVLALTAELVCVACAIALGALVPFTLMIPMFLVEGMVSPWKLVAIFASAAFALVVLIGAWGLSFAVSVPYKYRTSVPGVELIDCECCGKRIPNLYHCPECSEFRWKASCFSLVWLASAAVTVAWAAHDATIALIMLWPKSRS